MNRSLAEQPTLTRDPYACSCCAQHEVFHPTRAHTPQVMAERRGQLSFASHEASFAP